MSENNIPCTQLVEDEFGHVVGTAEIESDGVNMVARITLDPDMAPRPNTILVEFSFLTGPEAYQDEPEVVETNEMQLPIFDDEAVEKLERLIKEYKIIKHIKENK